MKKPKKWGTLAAIALVAVPAALAIPALPAVGQSSAPVAGVRLTGKGTIGARGAVASTGVQIACPATDVAFIQVQVTERSGNAIAQGTGQSQAKCNGNIKTVSVPVTPVNKPFVVGKAFGEASIYICDMNGCSSNTDARNVKLTK